MYAYDVVSVRSAIELFPFLANYAVYMSSSISIEEVNASIIYVCNSHSEKCEVFLLDEKGKELAKLGDNWAVVKDRAGMCWPVVWLFIKLGFHSSSETVKDALTRIGSASEAVSQILVRTQKYGQYSTTFHLYRVPKTYTLFTWLEELEKRRQRAEDKFIELEVSALEKKIESIDAKGNNMLSTKT